MSKIIELVNLLDERVLPVLCERGLAVIAEDVRYLCQQIVAAQTEPNAYRLYYRYTKEPVYAPQLDENGNQKYRTLMRYDYEKRMRVPVEVKLPDVVVGYRDIPDAPWVLHRNKTYTKEASAKQARSYHYIRNDGAMNTWHKDRGLECKIVPVRVDTNEG